MVKSFKDKEAKKVFACLYSKKFNLSTQKIIIRKLWMIDSASNINDLRIPPANHLEKLRGNRKGQYSIRVDKKLRICFIWKQNNAYQLEIVDYH